MSGENAKGEKTACPICGSREYHAYEFTHDSGLAGKILIVGGRCRRCGYKTFNVISLESSEPTRITVHVDSQEALNSLLYRGKTATIKIPEFNVEISPGPYSDSYITTVEGVLHRILEVLETCDEDDSECVQVKRAIRDAIEGKVRFTLIIEDPLGVSTFIPKDKRRVKFEKTRLTGGEREG